MGPTVTVAIVFYNGENFLGEAIASVLAQTFPGWELLLVDDGSTDGGPAIARAAAAERPGQVRCLAHPDGANHGLVAGRALGAEAARGEYLLFLDHDDLLYPDALARMVPLLTSHPRAAAVFAGTHYWAYEPGVREPDGYLEYRRFGTGPIAGRRMLRELIRADDNHPPVCSTLFRRAEYLAARALAGPYEAMYEDTAQLFKLLARHDAYLLAEPVSHYRMHGASMCQQALAGGTLANHGYSDDRLRFLRWAAAHVPLDPLSRALLAAQVLRYRVERRVWGVRFEPTM